MEQIEFRVKRVTQKELYCDFLSSDLSCEPAQSRFVIVGRYANRQLGFKLFGESVFQSDSRLIVEFVVMPGKAERVKKLILGQLCHSDEQTATMTVSTRPGFNM